MSASENIKLGIARARNERGVEWGRGGRALAAKNTEAAQEFAETMRAHLIQSALVGPHTFARMARALNAAGVPSLSGGKWYGSTVSRMAKRLPGFAAELKAAREQHRRAIYVAEVKKIRSP